MAIKLFKRRYGQRYPWAEWFRLRKFKLLKGKHYRYASYSMAQMVRNAAIREGLKAKGKRVSIQIDPKDRFIIVRVVRIDYEKNGKKDWQGLPVRSITTQGKGIKRRIPAHLVRPA